MSDPPHNFAAWLLEAGHADHPALVVGADVMTYSALRERVRRIAGFVQARHAGRREIVPLIGETSIELVCAYLGVLYGGAIPAPLGPASEEVLRGVVDETSARMTLVAGESPARSAVDVLVACAYAIGEPAQDVPVGPDDVAALMYTSGSTGRSRGVIVSARNLWANTRAIMEAVPLTAGDRALLTLPLYYCYGASVLHTHLRAGATIVMSTDTYPAALVDELSATRATALPAVPSLIQMLVARGALANASLPDLRWVMVSGGRLAESTVRELRTALPHVRIYVRYGVTELTAAASILSHERIDDKHASIGRGLPSTPLRVERPDGYEVIPGSGEVGEIVGRGDQVTLGYFNAPDETARAFRAGGFHTGDLATVDIDGFVTVVGREKEFVKTGGHRVAPQEIDSVLMRHPDVQSALACGVAHPLRGEALVAAVVARDGATLSVAELRRHSAAQLPPYKVPVQFHVLTELPRTRTGKLDRRALAARLSAMDAASPSSASRPFAFGRALGTGDVARDRLVALLRSVRAWFEVTPLDRLLDQVFPRHPRCRSLFDGAVIDHVGFLVPHWGKDVLGHAATEAGFSLGHRAFPSMLIARELGRLSGKRRLSTQIFKAYAHPTTTCVPAFEAFIPTAEDGIVERWMHDGAIEHVAVVVERARFEEIRAAAIASGFPIAGFMYGRAAYVPGEDATMTYYDLGGGEYPYRLEVRTPGDLEETPED